MVPARPVAAFVLGLVGGIFIVLGGIFFSFGFFFFGFLGLLGIVFGILVIVGSVLMYAFPSQHVVWGVVVLVFAITSILSLGGFIVGLVLGIVGGALGIAWRPGGAYGGTGTAQGAYFAGPYGVPVMPWRMCMGCGRWIPWAYNQCPLCGTAAPLAPWVPRAWEAGAAQAAPPGQTASPTTTANPGVAPAFAASPPQEQEPAKAPCPTCDQDAEWLPTYRRWYCRAEARYF